MATEKTPTLVELAEKLLEQARELEKVIPAPPTFQEDTPANLPQEYEKIRLSLIDKAKCSRRSNLDEVALHVIYHFRIPPYPPSYGTPAAVRLLRALVLGLRAGVGVLVLVVGRLVLERWGAAGGGERDQGVGFGCDGAFECEGEDGGGGDGAVCGGGCGV
ncbi:hypothetical protein AOQ84DRAFT_230624 [Glonium stellatum]|uniref:Uncharacterized protein n=1 Tax=Glonium stellatum TaxID=574774 RepID=A0A8E2JV15_9PEZI|nr:hypothetical protein AOQ84DRAFT_230624 [Glonium stellatum]